MRSRTPDSGDTDWNAGQAVDAIKSLDPVEVAFAAEVSFDKACFTLDQFRGARTKHMFGLVSPIGSGLGGKCIAIVRPVVVADYTAARGITHEFDQPVSAEGVRALFAVPVVRDGVVRGLVYGGARRPLAFDDRFLDIAIAAVRASTAAPPKPPEEPVTRPLSSQDVQKLYSELRELAHEAGDGDLRKRLLRLGDGLCCSPDPSGTTAEAPRLSPREVDVLAEIAIGCDNAEVVRRLSLTVETVRSYLKSAMLKLGTHNRTAAVYEARRAGLLP